MGMNITKKEREQGVFIDGVCYDPAAVPEESKRLCPGKGQVNKIWIDHEESKHRK